MNTKQIAKEIE